MPAPDRPRVLFVTHRMPYPPDRGDRIRTYNTLRELAKRADVHLLALAEHSRELPQAVLLMDLCPTAELLVYPRLGRLLQATKSLAPGRSVSEAAHTLPAARDAVRRLAKGRPFDAALASASSVASYIRDAAPVTVVDLVDVDSAKWADYADRTYGPKRMLYRREGRCVAALERRIGTWATAVAVVSDAEAATLREAGHPGPVVVAPNGVDLDYWGAPSFSPLSGTGRGAGGVGFLLAKEEKGNPSPPAPLPVPERGEEDGSPACLFVGVMDYKPNVDAVTWFAREVWPGVRARHADAQFQIVGRNPTRGVRALMADKSILVTGGVDDVRPYVEAAGVSVAPLRLGRGLQNKVLEAMASRKPVVASPRALAGIPCEPGRDLLRADGPAEWVEAVSSLFADPGRRAELGTNARRYVEAHHRWDVCLKPLIDAVLPAGVAR